MKEYNKEYKKENNKENKKENEKENKKQKKSRLQFLNRAVGYEQIKSSAQLIGATAKSLFVKKERGQSETFEEAVKRMHLTEADLQERMKHLKASYILFSVIALVLLGFGVLELFRDLGNAILSLALSFFVAVLAYKQSFWMYQIRVRRLGCTFQEWWRG